MRYQNWDVLVFPDESKVPIQEFKTSCHVIDDPVVTSFIPSLSAGAVFRISIHSWHEPELSDPLKKSNMFQARLYVDGRITGHV
ncbi:hypothetical protein D0Z07_2358 [Hyphodiscus hymeniophilus]|uniref:Uncharacterized protein n=1 Tax=Hyphodiscus hymeniophilus TaxID=353542 RepID=A0A9P6VMM5_9HELO|nr:hypothetical protein D0Z07_2358 [Hyphodiscus hymeniophilus]